MPNAEQRATPATGEALRTLHGTTERGFASGSAPARAALAGNPSDGYGGAVLAITVDALAAHVVVGPPAPDTDSIELVRAAVDRFAREHAPAAAGAAPRCATTIPRSVGLGGSSAIVIATLRALCAAHAVELTALELAQLALAVEVEELGIAAGPQDRIAQSFGGLTFMDFAGARFERLDPRGLPPLLIAWDLAAAAHSGEVHDHLRARHERGEQAMRTGMDTLARAAHHAREAVLSADHGRLCRALDASFDARAAMVTLDPAQARLVWLARSAGASANYAGSGGAIVCACRDDEQRLAVSEALNAAGCDVLPLVSRPGQMP